jgi:hypothetical protein
VVYAIEIEHAAGDGQEGRAPLRHLPHRPSGRVEFGGGSYEGVLAKSRSDADDTVISGFT